MTRKELKPTNPNNRYISAYNSAVKQGRHLQHVVPHPEGWAVKKITASKPTYVEKNQQTAIQRARRVAANQRSGFVVVHRRDGSVQSTIPCH